MIESTQNVTFSPAALARVQEVIKQYPEGKSKSALIPILHIAQSEFDGWLSVPAMDHVASILNIQPIEVYEVATFYSMFNLKPVARYLIEICRTSSCWMCGAEDIVSYLCEKLNVEVGEISADGMFQIKMVECLGSCGTAPMFQVGSKFYENLTFEKIDQILEELRNEN